MQPVPEVGARFKGSNANERARWSTKPRVVAATGDATSGLLPSIWSRRNEVELLLRARRRRHSRYRSFEMLFDMPFYFRWSERLLMGVTDRQADLEKNMAETLERLKTVAERR